MHNDMMRSFCDNMDKLTAAIQGKRHRRPTEDERHAEYREMEQELAQKQEGRKEKTLGWKPDGLWIWR